MKTKSNIGENKMAKFFISSVEVIEGDLYELFSEDCKIFVFDSFIRAICDGEVYDHRHIFKGSFVDDEGINRPAMNAVADAHTLADQVSSRGYIDTKHWDCVGNLSEIMKSADERLEEAWSDISDHYEN
jgi:hypothetical protein